MTLKTHSWWIIQKVFQFMNTTFYQRPHCLLNLDSVHLNFLLFSSCSGVVLNGINNYFKVMVQIDVLVLSQRKTMKFYLSEICMLKYVQIPSNEMAKIECKFKASENSFISEVCFFMFCSKSRSRISCA